MSDSAKHFYVYVYIDPRNLQEFYYGKGQGSRSHAHLNDNGDSEKAQIIKDIKAEGLDPIIRVIASGLTESEAFLIEKTLIWKLGKTLTNVSSGHFSKKFRPHSTLHKKISGFDYKNGVFLVNVGEGDHRCWADCKKYGFLSAGQDWRKWGSKMYSLNVGDIVVAYLAGSGYVGVGRVIESAVPVEEFRVEGKTLTPKQLIRPALLNPVGNDPKNGEHVVSVEWVHSVEPSGAAWLSRSGLFSTQLIVASLEKQLRTLEFLEKVFQLSFDSLLQYEKDDAAA